MLDGLGWTAGGRGGDLMKYKITLSAFVTRMATRSYTVYAKDEDEARQKAYDRMVSSIMSDPNVVEVGDPDFVSVEDT